MAAVGLRRRGVLLAVALLAALASGAKRPAEAVVLDASGRPDAEATIVRRQPSADGARRALGLKVGLEDVGASSLSQMPQTLEGASSTANASATSAAKGAKSTANASATSAARAKANTNWKNFGGGPVVQPDVITIDPDSLKNFSDNLGNSETASNSLPVTSVGNNSVMNASNVPLNAVPLVPTVAKANSGSASAQGSASSTNPAADPVVKAAIRAAAREAEKEAEEAGQNQSSNTSSEGDDAFDVGAFKRALWAGLLVMFAVWCGVGSVVVVIACCCGAGKTAPAAPQSQAAVVAEVAAQPPT